MPSHNLFAIPIHNPVLAFLLVLGIILLAPLFMTRLKIPSIIGLILAGVVIGPHGIGLLERNSSTVQFATIGLLYIMFLAALELDLHDFKKNQNRSLLFGLLTFALPFSVGLLACRLILQFDWVPSILVSSMFSTHTLLSYPIASRLGLTKNETVTIAVGGTIITDTAVLIVLAVIAALSAGDISPLFWAKMGLSLAAFTFVVLWGFPRIGEWFFRNIEGEKSAHFIFVLTMVFLAGFLAEVAGVEAIIGAFLAGLALNRLIPHTSALMNRIEFVGHAIFIPYFLISVGMLVDLRVLFKGWNALTVAFVLTVVALLGKWLAAYLAGHLFKYSKDQINVLFGLTSAHAAATIAVIMVGYNLKIIDESVLNGTILLILVACLVASFVTERSGRKLAISEAEAEGDDKDSADQAIMTTIKNPDTLEPMLDLAMLLKAPKSKAPIYALRVVRDNDSAQSEIIRSNKILEKAIIHAAASETEIKVLSRLDVNPAGGITRAAKETTSGYLLLGWRAKLSRSERIFGSTLEQILTNTDQTLFVCNLKSPLNTIKRLVVVVPPNAEREKGFHKWKRSLSHLAKNLDASQLFYCNEDTRRTLKDIEASQTQAQDRQFENFEDWDDFLIVSQDLRPTDMLVIVNARSQTISHNHHLDKVPGKLAKHFDARNFMMIYPEQHPLELLEMPV